MALSDKVKAAILGITGVVTIAGAKYNAREIIQKYEDNEIDEKELAALLEDNRLDEVDNLSDINEALKELGVEVAEDEEDIKDDDDAEDIEDDDDAEDVEDDVDAEDVEDDDDAEDIEDDDDAEDIEDDDDAEDIEDDNNAEVTGSEIDSEDTDDKDSFGDETDEDFDNTNDVAKTDEEKRDPVESKDFFGDDEGADDIGTSDGTKTEQSDRAEDREKFLANFDQKSANELKESDPEQYDRMMAANKMAIREEIDEAGGGETCWDNMSTSEMFDMLDKNPDRAKALMQDYQDRHPYGDSDFESPNTKNLIEERRAESKAERDDNDGIPKDMLESENPYKEFTQIEKTDAQRT